MKFEKPKTIEISQGNKKINVALAHERINSLRKSNVYSVDFPETRVLSVYINGKDIHGWFATAKVSVGWMLPSELPHNAVNVIPKEQYMGSYFKQFDNTEFGSPETALATAQTRALAKALGHAGIGTEETLSTAEEMMGSKLSKANLAPLATQDTIDDINEKINTIVNKEKEEHIPVIDDVDEENPDKPDMNNAGEVWEYIFEKEYISRDSIGKNFKPMKTAALGDRIISAFEEAIETESEEPVIALIKSEKWDERFPESDIVKEYIVNTEEVEEVEDESIDIPVDDEPVIEEEKTEEEEPEQNKGFTQTKLSITGNAYLNQNTKDNTLSVIIVVANNDEKLDNVSVMLDTTMGFIQADVTEFATKENNLYLRLKTWDAGIDVNKLVKSITKDTTVTIIEKPKTGKPTSVKEKPLKENLEEKEEGESDKGKAFLVLKQLRETKEGITDQQITEIIKKEYDQFKDITDFAYKCTEGQAGMIRLKILRS